MCRAAPHLCFFSGLLHCGQVRESEVVRATDPLVGGVEAGLEDEGERCPAAGVAVRSGVEAVSAAAGERPPTEGTSRFPHSPQN